MKLRKLVTKVMSMALACVMLATTVPVMADEVTDKQYLDVQFTNPADALVLTTEDNEAVWEHLGADTVTGADIDVLDADSGLYVDLENSIVEGFAAETNTGLNNVYEVSVSGLKLSRNDSGELVVDEWTNLASTTCFFYETEDDPYTFDGVIQEPRDTYKVSFWDDTVFNYEIFASDLIDEIEYFEYDYDMYHVRYCYLTADGEDRWTGTNFILEGQEVDSVLDFVEEDETPEVTPTPNTPVVNESYKVELPTDNTAISATDFSAILAENATKDVVIESNENVTFSFAKGTMSAVEGMEKYDFGTSVVSDFASAGTMSSNVTADNFVTRINFNYSGKLPATASIKIFVGTEYAGKTLYYSKIVESGFTYITSAVVDAEGYIVVTQDSCSDYVLTTEKLGAEDTTQTPPSSEETPTAPKTGDTSSVALWMMVAICGLGCVVCGLKSRKVA